MNKRILILSALPLAVIVTFGRSATISQRIANCRTSNCFSSLAAELLGQYSTHQALVQAQVSNPNSCHRLTHFIGQRLYLERSSATQAFSECNGTCFGGCYHGVVEGYLASHPSLTLGELPKICGDIVPDASSGLYQDCLHGLGHGVMAWTGGDLPKSLGVCDELPTPDYCYLGVFMENATSQTNPTHPSRYLSAKDPLYPCDSLDAKYLPTCYTAQSNYFLEKSGGDWDKTVELCLTVPTPYQPGCANYVGGNTVFYGQAGQSEVICNKFAGKNLRQACLEGANNTSKFLSR